MRSKVILSVLVLFTCVFTVLPANAALVDPFGDPVITGSWSQSFTASNFDKMEVFILPTNPDVDFESPGIDSFTTIGWSATLINPDYVLATGPPSSPLTWWEHYNSNMNVPILIDHLLYLNGSIFFGTRFLWTGSQWVRGPWDPNTEYNRSSVPEPSTLLLLGSGLVGLVGYGRRRLKR